MMRCAQKWPRLVYFQRADNTLPVFRTVSGEEIVTWSTAKHAIAGRATTPLLHIVQPDDEWSRMRRASFDADSWLTDEREETSEYWTWQD